MGTVHPMPARQRKHPLPQPRLSPVQSALPFPEGIGPTGEPGALNASGPVSESWRVFAPSSCAGGPSRTLGRSHPRIDWSGSPPVNATQLGDAFAGPWPGSSPSVRRVPFIDGTTSLVIAPPRLDATRSRPYRESRATISRAMLDGQSKGSSCTLVCVVVEEYRGGQARC